MKNGYPAQSSLIAPLVQASPLLLAKMNNVEPKPDGTATPISTTSTLAPPYSAFSLATRRMILGLVTAAGFLGPLCGAIYLPSLPLFEDIFHTSTTGINASVTLYMVVFAIAPLFWAAAADHWGRRPVYTVSLAIFIASNILLAAVPANIAALFILRILQALGSSAVTSVGAGTVADITEPKSRASAMSIFLLGPHMGPILGPLIGGQFAAPSRWRWAFGFLAIACFPIYAAIQLWLPETLRTLVGNGESQRHHPLLKVQPFRQKREDGKTAPSQPSRVRVFWALLVYPPNLIIIASTALLFAGLYAILVDFTRLWVHVYGWSEAQAGYAYLCPGLSLFLGSLAGGKASDLHRARAIATITTTTTTTNPANQAAAATTTSQATPPNPNPIPPESRIPLQAPGYILTALALPLYGWLARAHAHPAATLFASALAGLGTAWVLVTSTAYLTESSPPHAARMVALAGTARNGAAAAAAAAVHPLVGAVGYGWCYSALGVGVGACVGGVWFLWRRGEGYRGGLGERMARAGAVGPVAAAAKR
ncbi:major facilitator superfamily transporter [Diplodia corticola]|uniref:Major facilitator superfamily transporter n=1 Tax=Diplodia corticola TaxID=236234 RepID=A0A1J9RV60_9PEZI|nr:major facilitator superfamily transporter [Diplodia corticola]OJD31397.1 major facilitator superfamily transporter [Diplodia corticola]